MMFIVNNYSSTVIFSHREHTLSMGVKNIALKTDNSFTSNIQNGKDNHFI